LFFKIIL